MGTTGWATAGDGTRVWYSDSGGDGPAVALLHGITMTSISNFGLHFSEGPDGRRAPGPGPTVHDALTAAGARVLAIDTRGHGRSGRSPDPSRYTGDVHAHDVVAVLDAADVARADVFGYSMGSITAMNLFGVAPERLGSVVLGGTGRGLVASFASTDWWRAIGECFSSGDFTTAPAAKMFRAFARLDDAHDFASIGAAFAGIDLAPADRLRAAPEHVLVANGEADDEGGAAAALAAEIPGATALVAGPCDHGMACSDPEYQAALVGFLAAHW